MYWTMKIKSKRSGKRKIAGDVRNLIRAMSRANRLWGAPRIHGELLKLGIYVSHASVSKYMVRHPKPHSQSWRVFLHNHAKHIVPVDFFTVPTTTFHVLFVLLVLSNDRRRIVHFNVTESPSAKWTGQQIIETFLYDTAPKYLLRDRDRKYVEEFISRVKPMDIKQVVTAYRSPLSLGKDCPMPRPTELPTDGPIKSRSVVGGLHHQHYRQAA